MTKFISKSELDSQKSDNKETHYVGTIYPQIFLMMRWKNLGSVCRWKQVLSSLAGIGLTVIFSRKKNVRYAEKKKF